jgi:hypothetical protein
MATKSTAGKSTNVAPTPTISKTDPVIAIAQVLAGTSRNADVKLLAKHWDKVVGMDSVKEDLLRQARAIVDAKIGVGQIPDYGRKTFPRTGTLFPKGMFIGAWINHYNGLWWGQITDVASHREQVIIHWYHRNDWAVVGTDSTGGTVDRSGLNEHSLIGDGTVDPRPPAQWKKY